MSTQATRAEAIERARDLAAEPEGTVNEEYDRALCELLADMFGPSRAEVAVEIGCPKLAEKLR